MMRMRSDGFFQSQTIDLSGEEEDDDAEEVISTALDLNRIV